MLLKYTPNGTAYRESPYTQVEEDDFHRRVGIGPVTVFRPAPVPAVRSKKPTRQPLGE